MPYPYGVLSPGEDAEAPPGVLSNLFAGFVNRAKQPLTAFYNAASMPEEQAQQQVRDVASHAVNAAVEPVKQAGDIIKPNPYPPGTEESSWYEGQRQKAIADWAPQTALSTMGTGGIAGVPVKGAETALGAGILRKQPPLIGGYHGTIAPEKFAKFKESDVDFGTHFDRNPNVAFQYSMGDQWTDAGKLTEGARTYPVVGDVKKPVLYPTDPVNWRSPESVIGGLKEGIDTGFKVPKGLLADMESAESSAGGWEKNFIPMLKDKKYDSILYPSWTPERSYSETPPTSYMALDASQVMPRYSPEAQELIKGRGVKEPFKKLRVSKDEISYWRDMPESERWQPPPTGPKPSSLTGLTINSKPTSLQGLNDALEMAKKGMLSMDEYLKLFRE